MNNLKDLYNARIEINKKDNINDLCDLIKCDSVINNGDRTIRVTHSSDPVDAILTAFKTWYDDKCDRSVLNIFTLNASNTLIKI